MLRSYNSQQETNKLRPEEDLENISFFEIGKSSHTLQNNKKMKPFRGDEFSSWGDKDQYQFMRFSCQQHQCLTNRNIKKSPDIVFKRTTATNNERTRFNNSVIFQTKKIDLGAKVSESINKYNLITKNRTYYSPRKILPLSSSSQFESHHNFLIRQNSNKTAPLQIKHHISRQKLYKKSRAKIIVDDNKHEENNSGHKRQLSAQVQYSIINYPISQTLVKKKKFKRFQNFPFPTLASRFCK